MALSKGAVEKAIALMASDDAESFSAGSETPLIADLGGRFVFFFTHEDADAENPTHENTLIVRLPAKAVDGIMSSLLRLHTARLNATKPQGTA
jgi:hypothetical protein